MVTILTIIETPSDAALFQKLFEKVKFSVISAEPSYASYLKTLQYDPDIVIMEVPQNLKTHLQFLRIIRNNKAINQKPFILYGPPFGQPALDAIRGVGADAYFPHPLDLKLFIKKIRDLIHHLATRRDTSTEVNQLDQDGMQQLRNKNIPLADRIAMMKKHIGRLMAFPATVTSILKVSQDPRSGARDLAQIIRSDPSVSTEILKAANSVNFSRGGKRICDIRDAVVRIGFSQTKNISMSLSVFEIMKNENYQTGFSHKEFWFHNLSVAIIAERIAKTSTVIAPEEAFIGGLLHDLGILLLNEFFNVVFLEILNTTTDRGSRFVDVEREMLGFTHLEVIGELIEEWNFPETIRQICIDAPGSTIFTKEYLDKNPLHCLVALSEIIANSLSLGREADCCVEPVPVSFLKLIRFPYGFHKAFFDGVYHDLNMFNSMLKIDARRFPNGRSNIKDTSQVHLLCRMQTMQGFNPVVEYLKSQNYSVTIANVMDAPEDPLRFHAILFPDAGQAIQDDIRRAGESEVTAFTSNKKTRDGDEPQSEESIPARLLVFDANRELEVMEKDGVVITRYPIDLRNVDLAIACLLNGLTQDTLNEYGNLKPSREINLEGAEAKKHVMIAHREVSFCRRMEAFLTTHFAVTTEIATEGPKALNLAKTSVEELSLVIVDQSIPMLHSKDLIAKIKSLPTHKRAVFCVVVNEFDRSKLAPLVKMGVRLFTTELSGEAELLERLSTAGLKRISKA